MTTGNDTQSCGSAASDQITPSRTTIPYHGDQGCAGHHDERADKSFAQVGLLEIVVAEEDAQKRGQLKEGDRVAYLE